jgi:hypothetical protein
LRSAAQWLNGWNQFLERGHSFSEEHYGKVRHKMFVQIDIFEGLTSGIRCLGRNEEWSHIRHEAIDNFFGSQTFGQAFADSEHLIEDHLSWYRRCCVSRISDCDKQEASCFADAVVWLYAKHRICCPFIQTFEGNKELVKPLVFSSYATQSAGYIK